MSFGGSPTLNTTDPFTLKSKGIDRQPLHSQKCCVSLGAKGLVSMTVSFFMFASLHWIAIECKVPFVQVCIQPFENKHREEAIEYQRALGTVRQAFGIPNILTI